MGCGSSIAEQSNLENQPSSKNQKADKTPQPTSDNKPVLTEQKQNQPEPLQPSEIQKSTEAPVQEKSVPDSTPPCDEQLQIGNDDEEAFGLLLCGAGESGKTTFTRQLKLRFFGGFDESEKQTFVNTIRGNLIETIQLLLVWLEKHDLCVEEDNQNLAAEVAGLDAFKDEFSVEVCEALRVLWQDTSIQQAFEHRDETPIADHMDYFFAKIDELVAEDYIPSDEDVLRARIRSCGIDSVTFRYDGAQIRIYDVGGQKNQRSKWDKVMQGVEGVIFCVSFAEFDKPMFEDLSTIRIKDSLEIFEGITHREKFSNKPFFLLANKIDEFSEKIRKTDSFQRVFEDYTGDPHDPDQCAQFLIDKFLERANPPCAQRPIRTYKIVALDSTQVVNTATGICKFIRNSYYDQ